MNIAKYAPNYNNLLGHPVHVGRSLEIWNICFYIYVNKCLAFCLRKRKALAYVNVPLAFVGFA